MQNTFDTCKNFLLFNFVSLCKSNELSGLIATTFGSFFFFSSFFLYVVAWPIIAKILSNITKINKYDENTPSIFQWIFTEMKLLFYSQFMTIFYLPLLILNRQLLLLQSSWKFLYMHVRRWFFLWISNKWKSFHNFLYTNT